MRLVKHWRTLLLLPVWMMVGCLPVPEEPLRLGTNVWPGYEPLYLARERGDLSDDQVALVELLSASEVMRAYRNGAIDAAALTLDEVISLRADGLRPVVVQVTDISDGADVILVRQGVERMQDLRGKRVGIEATALGMYMLSRALRLSGMTLEDVDIVHMEVNEHRKAWLSGRVDAVVTFEPVRHQLLEEGAVVLFDSSMIPGEIVDLLVVRESLLKSRRKQIQHLITAWHRALERLEHSPGKEARIMAARLGGSGEDVLNSLKQLKFPNRSESAVFMHGDPSGLEQQAERLAQLMLEQGLLRQRPDLNGLVYRDSSDHETDH